jgi:hypothetical protein
VTLLTWLSQRAWLANRAGKPIGTGEARLFGDVLASPGVVSAQLRNRSANNLARSRITSYPRRAKFVRADLRSQSGRLPLRRCFRRIYSLLRGSGRSAHGRFPEARRRSDAGLRLSDGPLGMRSRAELAHLVALLVALRGAPEARPAETETEIGAPRRPLEVPGGGFLQVVVRDPRALPGKQLIETAHVARSRDMASSILHRPIGDPAYDPDALVAPVILL